MTAVAFPGVRADAIAATRAPAIVRAAVILFVLSIPFESPHRVIPLEIPTLTGLLLLASSTLAPRCCYRRLPAAFIAFAVYVWVFVVSLLVAEVPFVELTTRLFVTQVLVILMAWVLANLFAEPRVLRQALLALVVACTVRAAIQLAGIGVTVTHEWTGGSRVTVLGQNANLSAMILSGGLVAAIGLSRASMSPPRWLRLFALPICLMIGIAIVQTGSRGGLLCAAAGVAAFCLHGGSVGARARNAVLVVAGLAVLSVVALRSDMMRTRLESSAEGHKLAGREQIYPAAANAFLDRPLLGWGPIANQYEISRRMREGTFSSRDAHNLLLELLSATGVLGALPFLAGILLVLRHAWRARDGHAGALPLALVAAALTGTLSGTWIAAKILWLAFAAAIGADSPRHLPALAAPGRD